MKLATRNKAVHLLRTTKYEQGTGRLVAQDDPNKRCVVGVLGEGFGVDMVAVSRTRAYAVVGDLLRPIPVNEIVVHNDNGWSFEMLADWLERQPVEDDETDDYVPEEVTEGVAV